MRRRRWAALGVVGLAVAAYWTATGGFDAERHPPAWLTARPIAHRGLHSGDSCPENSLAAFRAAAEAGYAIELDVRLTSDGRLVVIHDENLGRMTGVQRMVADTTVVEVTALRLLGSSERVPTLTQVLNAVAGRVPIFVEVKNNRKTVGRLEDEVVAELAATRAPVAILSFNPFSLARIAEKSPDIPRGQISGTLVDEELPIWQKFLLRNLMMNWKSHPDFVVYQLEGLPSRGTWLQRRRGRPVVVWTAATRDEFDRARGFGDAVMFEREARPAEK